MSSSDTEKAKNKAVLSLDKEERTFLMEIGITAAGNGYTDESLEIFEALEMAGGNPVSLSFGRCVAYAGGRDLSKALEVLDKSWNEKEVTEVDVAMTLLALKVNNLETAAAFANRCGSSADPILVNFADNALKQIADRLD